MGIEIERKFLVNHDGWRSQAAGTLYRQGYLLADQGRTVRVRIAGDRAFLTIKGPSIGLSRAEFEYEIPPSDAEEMLRSLCVSPIVEKTRYTLPMDHLVWEIDEFMGANAGLILAEVELQDEQQAIVLPDWIGEEVSGDRRYYNSYLSQHPFSQWT
jgi:adenylate cyclase